jgi:hypothetical protein
VSSTESARDVLYPKFVRLASLSVSYLGMLAGDHGCKEEALQEVQMAITNPICPIGLITPK